MDARQGLAAALKLVNVVSSPLWYVPMTPDEYCQTKAAGSGSSFYYSFLFLDEAQRQAITALYAYCREVDDIVDECTDTSVAQIKLNWWREELDKLFAQSPRHPVSQALQPAIENFHLPQEHFIEILDGMEMDLHQHHYEDFKALQLYCHRVAGVVGLLSAEIFGYEDRDTRKYAQHLGLAFQLTNILRDVGEDLRRGRIYLPQDEMQRHGVSQQDLHQPHISEALKKLLAQQARRARSYYESAFEHLPEQDRYKQRSGIIMAAIYQRLLDEIERDNFNVLHQRISLTPLRKFWIAWRTARYEKRRARKAATA